MNYFVRTELQGTGWETKTRASDHATAKRIVGETRDAFLGPSMYGVDAPKVLVDKPELVILESAAGQMLCIYISEEGD